MLSHLSVLDLTDERGFLAGKILGDLGANVVKVEPPGGDAARFRGPFLGGVEDPERSLTWLALNTSKRAISLDLSVERGVELFEGLVGRADVVLESFAPGALADLGLGLDRLRELNPGCVVCSITPFGQRGPYAHYRAHDLVVVALGGNMGMTGDPDRPPVRCSMPTAYYHAAPEAVLGILMALQAREQDGLGDVVDVSMHECQLGTLLSGAGQYGLRKQLNKRTGGRLGRTREIWATRDGYVSFGLRGGPARIPNLVATVRYMQECGQAPQWLVDTDWSKYNPQALSDSELARIEAAFESFFASRTMRELYDEALRRRILLAPCNDAREILEHPQLRDRALFVTLDYPELGASIEHPGFFARSSRCRIGVRGRAPRRGEHNAEVFGDLGLGERDLDELRRARVI